MIWLILVFIFILAVLDTVFGNKIFPSKTGVIKIETYYAVYKWHRYFFIHVKEWTKDTRPIRFTSEWTSDFDKAAKWNNKEQAINCAMRFANQSFETAKPNITEVWSSRRSKSVIPSEDELTLQLGQAIISDNKELELELMSKLKEYKYI